MNQYYRFDKDGYFVEDVIADYGAELPEDITDVRPPQPMYKVKWNGKKWKETGGPDIEMLRVSKKAEINTACTAVIYAGVDVETSFGLKHFNLSDHDQANLNGIAAVIGSPEMMSAVGIDPAQGVWYKADGDGETHQYWPVEDFVKIASAVFKYKSELLTYCEYLKNYVDRLTDAEEIKRVEYGMALPGSAVE